MKNLISNYQQGLKILFGTTLLTGYLPLAPATFSSLFALLLPILFKNYLLLYLLITLCYFFLGIKIASELEELWGKDARKITCDEVLGILITFIFVPITLKSLTIGFLLFRFFDIVKLPFIKKAQEKKGGWGIMLDDFYSGLLANAGLRIILALWR